MLSGTATPLAFGTTATGLLVELEPIVHRLGGRLEVGPLRQSYSLAIGEASSFSCRGAPRSTSGTEIQALSQAPAIVDGRLLVPLELLERSYGARVGSGFDWDEARAVLQVTRPPQRELPLEIDLVHLQGVRRSCCSSPRRRATGCGRARAASRSCWSAIASCRRRRGPGWRTRWARSIEVTPGPHPPRARAGCAADRTP